MEPAKILLVKCEETPDAADGVSISFGSEAGVKRGVGRLVDSTQADDRRMIHLVRERPLLYARSNLPVASYHSQVKKLWREVADIMGWTVADVRRKWSHIRNSYSRHLRNEIHGVRTGRGRIVSRWYLADELEYLREHMATDTRPCPLSMVSSMTSFPPHFLSERSSEGGYLQGYEEGAPEPVEAVVEVRTETSAPATPDACFPPSDEASSSYEPDSDPASYFQFFRGIYKDYQELSPRRQRRFRRQCLVFLHRLVDAEEGGGDAVEGGQPVNLSSRHNSSDSERDAAASGAFAR